MKIKHSQLRSMIMRQLLREAKTIDDLSDELDGFDALDRRAKNAIRKANKEGATQENLKDMVMWMTPDEDQPGMETPEPEGDDDDTAPAGDAPTSAPAGDAPAEEEEEETEVEWDRKTYTQFMEDEKEFPLEIGEKGPRDGPIGKLQAAIGSPQDGWYGPNTAKKIGEHESMAVDFDGQEIESVDKLSYDSILAKPVAAPTRRSTSAETGGPAAEDDGGVSELSETMAAEWRDFPSFKGNQSIVNFYDDLKEAYFTDDPQRSKAAFDSVADFIESDTFSQAGLADAVDAWDADYLKDVERILQPLFRTAPSPTAANESLSRARLRSMILREILRKR